MHYYKQQILKKNLNTTLRRTYLGFIISSIIQTYVLSLQKIKVQRSLVL